MWVLKFKAKEEFNLYNKRTLAFGVQIYFYSRNYYQEGKKLFFINSGVVSGSDAQKKKFFVDLKKDSQIVELEINGDYFISVYVEDVSKERVAALKTVYNQKIIFVKPVLIAKDGFEEWDVASFHREDLENIIIQAKKYLKGKFVLLNFKQKKVKNLMHQTLMPDLSKQQQIALELAIKHEYYGYPRKITLKKLATFMNISESTYQFHLAKAEEKVIPFISKQ